MKYLGITIRVDMKTLSRAAPAILGTKLTPEIVWNCYY